MRLRRLSTGLGWLGLGLGALQILSRGRFARPQTVRPRGLLGARPALLAARRVAPGLWGSLAGSAPLARGRTLGPPRRRSSLRRALAGAAAVAAIDLLARARERRRPPVRRGLRGWLQRT